MALNKPTFCDKVITFFENVHVPEITASGVEAIEPHKNQEVFECVQTFYKKYFYDTNERVFVLGINPGRFGSGVTGIPFTCPVALSDHCGIPNTFKRRSELSSEFLHTFIGKFGGVEKFYSNFFLTSVSPIGFIRHGKNYNYYDSTEVQKTLEPFIVESLIAQFKCGARDDVAIILGSGKNYKFFTELNEKYRWFSKVYPLEHPRYIMQYKRKELSQYLDKYHNLFTSVLQKGDENAEAGCHQCPT